MKGRVVYSTGAGVCAVEGVERRRERRQGASHGGGRLVGLTHIFLGVVVSIGV
jgi:hypothetical protein